MSARHSFQHETGSPSVSPVKGITTLPAGQPPRGRGIPRVKDEDGGLRVTE